MAIGARAGRCCINRTGDAEQLIVESTQTEPRNQGYHKIRHQLFAGAWSSPDRRARVKTAAAFGLLIQASVADNDDLSM
jgi:hypothetical protein